MRILKGLSILIIASLTSMDTSCDHFKFESGIATRIEINWPYASWELNPLEEELDCYLEFLRENPSGYLEVELKTINLRIRENLVYDRFQSLRDVLLEKSEYSGRKIFFKCYSFNQDDISAKYSTRQADSLYNETKFVKFCNHISDIPDSIINKSSFDQTYIQIVRL